MAVGFVNRDRDEERCDDMTGCISAVAGERGAERVGRTEDGDFGGSVWGKRESQVNQGRYLGGSGKGFRDNNEPSKRVQ